MKCDPRAYAKCPTHKYFGGCAADAEFAEDSMNIHKEQVKEAIVYFRNVVNSDSFSAPLTTYARVAVVALEYAAHRLDLISRSMPVRDPKANDSYVYKERLVDLISQAKLICASDYSVHSLEECVADILLAYGVRLDSPVGCSLCFRVEQIDCHGGEAFIPVLREFNFCPKCGRKIR